MADKKTASDLKSRFLDILDRHRMGFDHMDDVRECLLMGDSDRAAATLVSDYEFSREDSEAFVEYMGPIIRGRRVTFVEIGHADIHFPPFDHVSDDEEPVWSGHRYFGRRGQVIGPVITTSSMVDGRQIDKVFFGNKLIEPGRLDQVWELVTDEAGDNTR